MATAVTLVPVTPRVVGLVTESIRPGTYPGATAFPGRSTDGTFGSGVFGTGTFDGVSQAVFPGGANLAALTPVSLRPLTLEGVS